jgi:23S rRNA pseudouridine2605 synthase
MNTTPPPGERIAKVLARAGVASRREAERMIEAGRVSVNGKTIDSPALNVTPADKITVDAKPLAAPEPPRLWLYHKPAGLVTSARDEKGRPTVFDALPEDMPRVMSVGRLDLNSEGLLLLTNDGEIKRRLELPSTGWLRKYRVRVKGRPDDAMLEPLRKGITIDGERFQPLADHRHPRRPQPRDPPRDGGRGPCGEPAAARQLWPVPARRAQGRRGRGNPPARAARPAWAG